jgi:lytic cellulose monooxygenase (C1-hydroxylating)
MARFALLGVGLLATRAAAHGYIGTFTLDGVEYEGFRNWNPNPSPDATGWSFTTPDEVPILDISSPDMACRMGSSPAQNYGIVAAGGEASFFWTSADKQINPDGWALSHRGPIMTYIAPCNGDCTDVDQTALRWTKISEEGLVSGTANVNGVWATDKMRENGGIVSAKIPSSIAPGKYVIRNEIIALHRAHLSEPEFYGQCGNIEITGNGSDDLSGSGVVAANLYSRSDNIFGFDVYNGGSETSWAIPGPAVYQGAGTSDGTTPPADESVETPVGEGNEDQEEVEEEEELECHPKKRQASKKVARKFRA